MAKIKDIIDNFIYQNTSVTNFLKGTRLKQNDTNSDGVIEEYKKIIVDTNYNVATGLNFAMLLQLLDDEKIIRQFELSDVERLFDSLMETDTSNLDNYIEAAHFQYNVLNNEIKAKEILNKGLVIANAKKQTLQQLLDNIEVG